MPGVLNLLTPPTPVGSWESTEWVFVCNFFYYCYLSETLVLRDPRLMVINKEEKTQKAPANYVYNK